MTCNPRWVEITEALLPGQSASDRPDIVNRVFKEKLGAMLAGLKSGLFFGGRSAYVIHVVEFQKRGLPHAHVALRIVGAQPDSAEVVDRYISCEMPDQVLQPELYDLVSTHMIHRKCVEGRCYKPGPAATSTTTGAHGPGRTRVVGCKYGYPFPCLAETTFDDSGRCWHRRRTAADMRVVSYNGALLLTFKCHINVQVASTAKMIKYLHKYMHKGGDTITIAVNTTAGSTAEARAPSEYDTWETERYISSTEAVWRILGYDINGCEPVVDAVGVHLPQRDFISFSEHDDIAARASGTYSQQTRWLLRPADPRFNDLSYKEYNAKYSHAAAANAPTTKTTYNDLVPTPHSHKVWKRPTEHCVRVYTSYLGQGQLYYFRKLVVAAQGVRSYHELATVAGVTHYLPAPAGSPPIPRTPVVTPSEQAIDVLRSPADTYDFHGAAIAAGLVCDGQEIRSAMQEAVDRLETPPAIRRLFVQLLQEAGMESSDTPEQLLDLFFVDMSKDFTLLLPTEYNIIPMTDPQRVRQAVLCELARYAALAGLTLTSLRLQEPAPAYALGTGAPVVPPPTLAEWRTKFDTMHAACSLFPEQKDVLERAMRIIDNDMAPGDSKLLFLDAPAGRGKTYLLNCIEAYVWSKGDTVCAAAFTGIAAMAHYRGATLHRAFGLPVGVSLMDNLESLRSTITREGAQATTLRQARLLVLDELATAHCHYLSIIDTLLRDLMGCPEEPFGGKVVIAAGDFRQTTVVVVGGSRDQVVQSSVKAFPLWSAFTQCVLTVPVRNASDPDLNQLCEEVGDGSVARCTRGGVPLSLEETALSVQVGGAFSFLLPLALALRVKFFTDATAFQEYVHPFASLHDPEHARESVKSGVIAGHNVVVDVHNARYLEELPGVLHTLIASEVLARDSDAAEHDFTTDDFLAGLQEPGKPPHILMLKINAYVTALRNMPIGTDVQNGSRMRVVYVGRFIMKVAVLDNDGNVRFEILIPRVTFPITLPRSGLIVHRRQFPVRLAYATTIHKQQGRTCPGRVGLDVTRPAFGHGTTYTALSRAVSADRMAFLVNTCDLVLSPEDGVTTTVILTSVIYPELLTRGGLPLPAPMPQPNPEIPPLPLNDDTEALRAWGMTGEGPCERQVPHDLDVDAGGGHGVNDISDLAPLHAEDVDN